MVSKQDCIDSLQQASDRVEGRITHKEYRDMDVSPSARTIIKKFGSWNAAKEKAGLETIEHGQTKSGTLGHFQIDYEGYHRFKTQIGESRYTVGIHRLVAVAEFGLENTAGNVVHHKNNIPWDNRPENLELMGHAEHARYHRLNE